MSWSPERQALIAHAARNAEEFRQGTGRLLTFDDLASLYPTYKRLGVRTVLNTEGLTKVRMDAAEQRMQLPYPPSQELAWMLGCAVSKAFFPVNKSCIDISASNPERNEKIARVSKQIFDVDTGLYPKPSTNRKPKIIRIQSQEVVVRLGDLKQDNFIQTAKERYGWVFEDPQFAWSFIEGVFDGSAIFFPDGIHFTTDSRDYGELLVDTLKKLGMQKPYPYPKAEDRKLEGIRITNQADLKILARNINPAALNAQKRLHEWEEYKGIKKSDEEIMQTWLELSKKLGYPARLGDVNHAGHNHELVGVSRMAFDRLFGASNYTRAKVNLDKVGIVTNRLFSDPNCLPTARELAYALPYILPLDAHPAEIRAVGLEAIKLGKLIYELEDVLNNQTLLDKTQVGSQEKTTWKQYVDSAPDPESAASASDLASKLREVSTLIQGELIYIRRRIETS